MKGIKEKLHTTKSKIIENKKKVLMGTVAGILVVTVATGSIVYIQSKDTDLTDMAAQLETVSITKQDLEKTLSINGTIAALESQSVTSELTGVKVNELKVRVGDHVKKGDVVAVLDTTTIEKSLAQAQESLELAKKKDALELATAQRNYDNAVEESRIQQERAQRDLNNAQKQYDQSVSESNTANGIYANAEQNVNDKTGNVNNSQNAYNDANSASRDASKDYERKQEALEDAQKKLTEAEQVKTTLDGMTPTTDEEKAQLEADKQEAQKALDEAKANVEKAEAEVREAKHKSEDAQTNLENKQTALSDSKSDLAEAEASKSTAEADAKSKKESISSNQDAVTKAQDSQQDTIRQTNKSVADAKDNVSSTELGQSSSLLELQREVDKYVQQIESATIVAPCDGLVTSVGLKEGALYDNGKELMTIQNDDGYKVKASVDQYDICDVQEGMKVRIKTDSMGDEILEGTVTFVSPIPASDTAGATTGSDSSSSNDYPIEVSINKKADRLRIGMTAKITIIEEAQKDALTVPDSVVQEGDDGQLYIEVLDDSNNINTIEASATTSSSSGETGNIKKENVSYGIKTDYYVEIKGSDLKEGMQVVVPSTDDTEDIEL
ncbi:MAG: HlyD family efflux transporter periplasmic adaptor subunit [Butyrivibrio sp.]|nr:HlyD family efflux transporter periplasmic adaptor subunit [Butyrivibrio sp.]